MTTPLDLTDFAALTPAVIEDRCREAMAACDAGLAGLAAIPANSRTFANTLLAMEEATAVVGFASGVYAFMASVSADEAVREMAREMDQALDKYFVGLAFRDDLYRAVREFAATPEAAALTGEDARLLAFELRDYRRNGFDLEAAPRARLKAILDELVEIGTAFRNAIDDWDDGIEVARDELDGLPDAYIAGLKSREADGETRYRVSLDYPELFPFLSNGSSERHRRELFAKDQRKGGPENLARLERALALRAEAAAILGYDSWASYVTETRMSKRRETVADFLAGLREKLVSKGANDLAAMAALKRASGDAGIINIWDWRFYHNRLLETEHAIDQFKVAEYFPLDRVLEGLFSVTQSMMGVRFEARPDASSWHLDVLAYDVFEAEGAEREPFARFYMDLFPRPNKYGHAAAFTLRGGRRLPDGSYQKPVSAIVANFTKPGADRPSLLRHSEVETLFHEFGHILHQVLTRTERGRFSGTHTERDFVEAPSQMMERWCWEPEVLQGFARHYETGEPIPADLVARMVAAKNLNSGITYLRQMFFACLDLAYHSPGFSGDSTEVAAELHAITGFGFTPETHFQSGFGHLFGYDAGYYGYLWSEVFGEDMYTRFEAAGPLHRPTGLDFRRKVLERGGSVDGDVLVRDFLGREPNNVAFLRAIGLS